jgi:hypothetical protein
MPYSFGAMTNPFAGLPLGKGVLARASQLWQPGQPQFTPWQRQTLPMMPGGGGTAAPPPAAPPPPPTVGPVTSPTGLTTQGATTISNTGGGPIPPSSQIQGNMTMAELIALINSSPPPPAPQFYWEQNPMPSDSPSSSTGPGHD